MRGCRPLTESEVQQVLASITGKHAARNKLLIILGIKAGFRISEILSLQVKDVYKNGAIPTHVTVQRRNMKGKASGRTVILHQSTKDAIIDYVLSNPSAPDAPLFRSAKGDKPITRQQAWNILEQSFEACNLTGVLGTHSLRKTFAARVYEASGHCLLKTKKALGHTDVRTTEKYLSFSESDVENIIASI